MGSPQVSERQHGLTPVQWGLLLVAFMMGLGSSFALRETILPPVRANETQVQVAPSNPDAAR